MTQKRSLFSTAPRRLLFAAALLSATFMIKANPSSGSESSAVDLRCEYLVDPIGLDARWPRFSWRMEDARTGARQSAFRVVVARSEADLRAGSNLIWDTGKVASDEQLLVYGGPPLVSHGAYCWRVEIWDGKDRASLPSAIGRFEIGMLEVADWRGSWISDSVDPHFKPAPHFRAEIELSKPVASVRAYIAAAGLYELHVNGGRIGDRRLDPMFTRFDRRILYATLDLTDQMREGPNAVGVILGDGWFNHQSRAVWGFDKAPWRGRPMFCLDVRIVYEDGSTEYLSSGDHWKTTPGPIISNSIYTGEQYDARRELTGWSEPGFDDAVWANAINRSAPTRNIVAQALQPIRAVERLAAVSVNRIDEKTYVYNLGRNIAGVSEVRLRGKRGAVLRIKHGEMLDDAGRVALWNIDVYHKPIDEMDPFQTDVFTLKGGGEEVFSPRFNYKGFQFVEVASSIPIELSKDSLIGLFVHSDVPAAGSIRSSNPTVDKIWEATRSSYLSNLHGYPTDCPQREKNGWTGDGHIAVETGLYGFDAVTIYEKWLDDHRDEQQPNGALPAIIPTAGWGYDWANGPDWTSSIAIIPWNLYLFYGDTRPLEENYSAIKRYVDRLDRGNPTGLTNWGLGDWVPVKSESPVELTSSIYFYVVARILSDAAGVLGHADDHRRYGALAAKIKSAVNGKYLDVESGLYGTGLQTELSAPLFWGLVPEPQVAAVAANLARRVEADGGQLDVGLLGSKAILGALSDNGYPDLAYALVARESYPSWGWWIVNGATTLHENWSLDARKDRSLNHIMFGEVGAWLFKTPGGIKPDPQAPGFKRILLAPRFVAGLQHFEASYQSPYGLIVSSWRRVAGGVEYTATIPPNSTASLTLDLPEKSGVYLNGRPAAESTAGIALIEANDNRRTYALPAGVYRFEIR